MQIRRITGIIGRLFPVGFFGEMEKFLALVPSSWRMDDTPKQRSLIDRRLIFSSAEIMDTPPEEIPSQHTVLGQTLLPYRNPGNAIRRWERHQGHVHL